MHDEAALRVVGQRSDAVDADIGRRVGAVILADARWSALSVGRRFRAAVVGCCCCCGRGGAAAAAAAATTATHIEAHSIAATHGQTHRIFWIRRQQALIVTVHGEGLAEHGHPSGATLMESEVALAAVEAREEQPATALAEGDREERFAYKLMLDVRPQRELVQQPHVDLLHMERANIRVPRYDMSAAMRRRAHLAHERLQLAEC